MVDAVQRHDAVVNQAVMAVPDRITREMNGFPPDLVDRWRDKAREYCRAALGEGARAVKKAMDELGGKARATPASGGGHAAS